MLTILMRSEPRVYHIRSSGRLTLIDRRAGDTVDGITVFLSLCNPDLALCRVFEAQSVGEVLKVQEQTKDKRVGG